MATGKKTNINKGSLGDVDNRRQFENTSASRTFTNQTFRRAQPEQVDRTNMFKQALGLAQEAVRFTAETPEQQKARLEAEKGLVAQNTLVAQNMLQSKLFKYQNKSAELQRSGTPTEIREFNESLTASWQQDVNEVNQQAFNGSPSGYSEILKIRGIHSQFNSLLTNGNALYQKKQEEGLLKAVNANVTNSLMGIINEDPIHGSDVVALQETEAEIYDEWITMHPDFDLNSDDLTDFNEYSNRRLNEDGFRVEARDQMTRIKELASASYTDYAERGIDNKQVSKMFVDNLLAKYTQTADIKYLDMLEEIKSPDGVSLENIANSYKGKEQQVSNLRSKHETYVRQFEARKEAQEKAELVSFQKERVTHVDNSFEDHLGAIADKVNQGGELTPEELRSVDAWADNILLTVDASKQPMYGGDGRPVARTVSKYIRDLKASLVSGEVDEEYSTEFLIELGEGRVFTNEELATKMVKFTPEAKTEARKMLAQNISKAQNKDPERNKALRLQQELNMAEYSKDLDMSTISKGYMASTPNFQRDMGRANNKLQRLNIEMKQRALKIGNDFREGTITPIERNQQLSEMYAEIDEQANEVVMPLREQVVKAREEDEFDTGLRAIANNTDLSEGESLQQITNATADIPIEELDSKLSKAFPNKTRRKQITDLLVKQRSLQGDDSESFLSNTWDVMKATDPTMKLVEEELNKQWSIDTSLNIPKKFMNFLTGKEEPAMISRVAQQLSDGYANASLEQLRFLDSQNDATLKEIKRLQKVDPEGLKQKYGDEFADKGVLNVLQVFGMRGRYLDAEIESRLKSKRK